MNHAARRSTLLGSLSLALLLLAASSASAGETAGACAFDALFHADAGPAAFCPIVVDRRVSTAVLSREVIRKRSRGVTIAVVVATTSTGTYTTDAMFAPGVRYPGIRVLTWPNAPG